MVPFQPQEPLKTVLQLFWAILITALCPPHLSWAWAWARISLTKSPQTNSLPLPTCNLLLQALTSLERSPPPRLLPTMFHPHCARRKQDQTEGPTAAVVAEALLCPSVAPQ